MDVDHADKRVTATVVFVGAGAERALETIATQLGREAARRDRALAAELVAPLTPVRGYELIAEVRAVDDLLGRSPEEREALLDHADGLACFGDRDRLMVKAACDETLAADVPALFVPPGETALAVFKGMGHALMDRVKEDLPAEPKEAEGARLQSLAGYDFLLPDFWGEPTTMAHEHLVGFDSYGTRDFGLLVRIAPDAGGEEAVDAYLTATRQRWTAETRVDAEVGLANLRFRGDSAYGCEDAHSVETLAGSVGPDLVAFHMVYVDKNPKHAQLRRLVLTMVETAIVRRWGPAR